MRFVMISITITVMSNGVSFKALMISLFAKTFNPWTEWHHHHQSESKSFV